jgi:hypothetical protein
MLKQDNGEYACIAEDSMRYNLGAVKEEMQAAMGLNTEVKTVVRKGLGYCDIGFNFCILHDLDTSIQFTSSTHLICTAIY